jgi:hypothetical protein
MRYNEIKSSNIDEGLFGDIKNVWDTSVTGRKRAAEKNHFRAYEIGLNDFKNKFFSGLAAGLTSRVLAKPADAKTDTAEPDATQSANTDTKPTTAPQKVDAAQPTTTNESMIRRRSILKEGAVENWVDQIIAGQERAGRWVPNQNYSTRAKEIGLDIEKKIHEPNMQNQINQTINKARSQGAPAINSALQYLISKNFSSEATDLWDLMWSWSQLGRTEGGNEKFKNKIEELEKFLKMVHDDPRYLKSAEAKPFLNALGILAKSADS